MCMCTGLLNPSSGCCVSSDEREWRIAICLAVRILFAAAHVMCRRLLAQHAFNKETPLFKHTYINTYSNIIVAIIYRV